MSVEAYQEHIDRLARGMGCEVRQRPKLGGMHYVEMGYVEGPIIRDQQDYLALLHELGHFALGHTQGRPPYDDQRYYFDNGVLRSEAEAWEWALNECLDIPTYKSRRFMWDYCLGSYYQASLKEAGRLARLPNGNRGHVEFLWDKPDAYFWSVVGQIQGGADGFLVPFDMLLPVPSLIVDRLNEMFLADVEPDLDGLYDHLT